MKTLLALFTSAALAFVVAFAAPAAKPAPTPAPAATYCGSSKSNVYHYPTCSAAKRIAASNRITFATKEEAAKRGYRPCKICKP